MRSQRGQALPLALIALAAGALLVTPFLRSVSTHSIASRNYSGSVSQQYSSDAGAEDAIWGLRYGTLAAQLTVPGASLSYTLGTTVNGVAPSISVTRDQVAIASDNFESGGWAGGSGWTGSWYHESDASITTSASPHGGSYHLLLRSSTGYARRSASLGGETHPRLQFWAKANSFESGETAQCLISANGTAWTAVKTWVDGDDDNTYHYYDIDLSPYGLSTLVFVAFDANMSAPNDYLYIDDVAVVKVLPGSLLGLPSDNFESGGWAGGSYWLYDWYHAGNTAITGTATPHQGSYHLRMTDAGSYVERAGNLYSKSGLHLQFWAKVNNFEGADRMYCSISPDHTVWTDVMTWSPKDSDDTYHLVDIDLSPYTMSDEFWIAFRSRMNAIDDYFYVDDLTVVGSVAAIAYEILSTAGSEKTRSDIVVANGSISIRSWQIERV